MSASETSTPEGPPPDRALARRIAWTAAGLVVLPLLVEATALDPSTLVQLHTPLFGALRLSLAQALPWLVVAVSVAALARVAARGPAPPRAQRITLGLAGALGVLAAVTTPSFEEGLAGGGLRVDGRCARNGSVLSPCVALRPVPLEDAGATTTRLLPPRAEAGQTEVRWVGVHTHPTTGEGRRVELVAGGQVKDVTDAWAALPVGGAAVFRHTVRTGPDVGRVHLRLADDPVPPSVFFDGRHAFDVAGLALVAGGGDQVRQAPPRTGPGSLPVPTLRVEGIHAEGGHALVVLSGEDWGVHDLRPLAGAAGVLELDLAVASAASWSVRLVGNGAESVSVPLGTFAHREEGGLTRFTLPLSAFPLQGLSPAEVVSVALVYAGPVGPFGLEVGGVRACLGGRSESGFAVATLAALDPGAHPPAAMFVAGEPPRLSPLAQHGVLLRLAAALLTVVGAVGPAPLWALVRAAPAGVALAFAAGPGMLLGLAFVLRAVTLPHLEHLPLALGATALAAAGATLLPRFDARRSAPSVRPEDPRLAGLEALMGVATLGIVLAHASADAAGEPWLAHPPGDRVIPVVAHTLTAGFEAPLFVLGALFVTALRPPGAPPAWRSVARRFVPALTFWSVAWLGLRFGKAWAFGYEAALRRELSQAETWLRVLLLGGAQYHLYVIPLLLVMVAASPLFRPAQRRPALGLGVFVTLGLWPAFDASVYAAVASPEARTWALRATMLLGFSGYGLVAYALAGCTAQARPLRRAGALVGAAVCSVVLVAHGLRLAEAGTWSSAGTGAHLATWLLPAALFALFVDVARAPAWTALRRLGVLAPGIYLLHPLLQDTMEILERGAGLGPTTTMFVNFAAVALGATLLTAVFSRVAALRPLLALSPERSS